MTTTPTTSSVYGKAYGGSAPENYQRYFVPAIGGPFAEDLIGGSGAPSRRTRARRCVRHGCRRAPRGGARRPERHGRRAGSESGDAVRRAVRSFHWRGDPLAQTSAESIPLPDDAFDVVLCQLGLQFVADKSAALREMRRVLAPGGRVLVTTPPPNAFFDVLDEAMTRHVGSDAGASSAWCSRSTTRRSSNDCFMMPGC